VLLHRHHIIVYYVDAKHAVEHHPCLDSEMISWHQIVGVSGKDNGEPVITFPEGVALKVPAGKQLVLQTHYINTTGATQKTTDHVALNLVDPKDVKQYSNLYAIHDGSFTIDPNAMVTSTSICTVDRDLSLLVLGGHMHEFGRHFKLERVDDTGATLETLYDKDWQPQYSSHPPILSWPLDKPLLVPKGTKFRQSCTWDNTTANPMLFPREMCDTFTYYVPDAGQLVCETVPEAPAK
jgi:hypothetical protein